MRRRSGSASTISSTARSRPQTAISIPRAPRASAAAPPPPRPGDPRGGTECRTRRARSSTPHPDAGRASCPDHLDFGGARGRRPARPRRHSPPPRPPRARHLGLGAARHAAEHARADFYATMLRKEMAFERAFAAAGGILMAGCDPTGDGHVIAGLGDQRNIELLVEAGFSIPEAIRIATLNGATYLGAPPRSAASPPASAPTSSSSTATSPPTSARSSARSSSSRTASAMIRT